MVNAELTRRIVVSDLHKEDAEDIIRIFAVLSEERQIYILDNWDTIVARMRASRRQFEEEQEILLRQAITRIEEDLAAFRVDADGGQSPT